MHYLVYQAYRNIDNLHECLYSLYSFAAYPGTANVVIYTDREDYLRPLAPPNLQITYRNLSEKEIDSWQGPAKFVHRFKICMLLDLVEQLNPEDQVLYVDTDVVFERSAQPLPPNKAKSKKVSK